MKKRELLRFAVQGTAAGLAAGMSLQAHAQYAPASVSGTVLLTVSGLIGPGNRGPIDPKLDVFMLRHQVKFQTAHAFDFAALSALPAKTIKPTLEYDAKPHTLKGPLLVDVLKATGVKVDSLQTYLLRGTDGYAVRLPAQGAIDHQFIVATHIDDAPLAIGGLGPLWVVYDADRVPANASKTLKERFTLCPWGTYHIEVQAG